MEPETRREGDRETEKGEGVRQKTEERRREVKVHPGPRMIKLGVKWVISLQSTVPAHRCANSSVSLNCEPQTYELILIVCPLVQ